MVFIMITGVVIVKRIVNVKNLQRLVCENDTKRTRCCSCRRCFYCANFLLLNVLTLGVVNGVVIAVVAVEAIRVVPVVITV